MRGSRGLDVKNIERLKANFREDCCRLDIHDHIPALIHKQDLDAAMRASGISANMLFDNSYPELSFPVGYKLECLHGRHRVQAGKEILPSSDSWWTVDLCSGIFSHLQRK